MTVAHSITSSARASSDRRHVEAERLGGLEVDHQLELASAAAPAGRRLLALENAAGIDADLTIRDRKGCSVAHQAAGHGVLAHRIDCRQRVARRNRDEPIALADEERIGADDERA